MTKFPIVIQGDWLQLIHEEAETGEEALINAATRYIESVAEDTKLQIGPRGVTGQFTPTLELRILFSETLELESEWTIPDQG